MKRIASLDRIRLIAVCLVILLHIFSGIPETMWSLVPASVHDHYQFFKALCACGVPLFLMISGVLLLDPEKEIPVSVLWKKYIRRMVLVILIFGTFFSFAELCALNRPLNGQVLSLLWQALLNALTGKTWAHLWYPYLMIAIYAITPLLKRFIRATGKRTQGIVLVAVFFLFSVFPFVYYTTGHLHSFLLVTTQLFLLWYYLAGYYAYTYFREAGKRGLVRLLPVVSAVAVFLCFRTHLTSNMNYDSPLIALYALGLFVCLVSVDAPCAPCTRIAPYVFGMYVTHAVLINLLYKVLGITPLTAGGYVPVPVFFAATFAFAFCASYVLRQIPWLRENVL